MADRVNCGTGIPVDASHGACTSSRPRGKLRLPSPLPAWLPWRPRCLGCGEHGPPGRDLCQSCEAALPRIRIACVTCGLPLSASAAGADADADDASAAGDLHCNSCRRTPPPLTRVVAPFLYAPPFDRWLPRFKFHRDLAAGRLLSQLMIEACADAPRPDAIIPIPLHRTRLRSRGYDQALELAKPLAEGLSIPLRGDLLTRRRATSAQSSLHAVDRRRNLRGAFAIAQAAGRFRLPAHVALVDDVMTTGATLHAAAQALKDAGVVRIDAWTCARAP